MQSLKTSPGMLRASPFRPQPPALVAKRIETALSSRMCLVQEVGPTCFVIQPAAPGPEDGATASTTDTAAVGPPPEEGLHPPVPRELCNFKVSVGDLQKCTCGDRELCVHILFVMLKVFRLPADNPLVWQKSLLDSEISKLLSERERAQQRHKPAEPTLPTSSKKYVWLFTGFSRFPFAAWLVQERDFVGKEGGAKGVGSWRDVPHLHGRHDSG